MATNKRTLSRIGFYCGLALFLIITLFPFFVMLMTSFKGAKEAISLHPTLLPQQWTLEHYVDIFNPMIFPFVDYFRNSLVVSVVSSVVAVFLGILGAYALSRLRFKGRMTINASFYTVYMFSGILLVVPLFKIITALGIYDTEMALIITMVTQTLPTAVFMLKSYFDTIPDEIEEAAMMDGLNRLHSNGTGYTIASRRFVSADQLPLIVLEITITPLDADASVLISTGIDATQTNHGRQHLDETQVRVFGQHLMQGIYTTQDGRSDVAISCCCMVSGDVQQCYTAKERRLQQHTSAQLHAGETVTLQKLVWIDWRDDRQAVLDEWGSASLRQLEMCAQQSYDQLLAVSTENWRQWWQKRRITVNGGEAHDQQALDYALYHLRIMTPAHDERSSIAAKGLTGEGYKGHVFWDTEVFLLPFHLFSDPTVARSLLRYRWHNLPGAQEKARRNGWQGALFPWESARSGEEETPEFAAINIRTGLRQKVASAQAEHHLVADIAWAVIQYWQTTGDESFIAHEGMALLLETAKFWISRAVRVNDRLEIHDVIGPDEYTEHVNNNAFTSYMAYYNVQQALSIARQFGCSDDAFIHRAEMFLKELRLPEIQPDGVLPQDDSFMAKPAINLAKYKAAAGKQTILLDYSRAEVNEMQILKQADVVMLNYMLPEQFSAASCLANLQFYEPRTIHDSSLSKAIHGIVAARCGLLTQSYQFWREGTEIDLGADPHSCDDGIHAAATGAIWLGAIQGFAGVSVRDGELHLNPALPEQWQQLSFPLFWQGCELQVTLDAQRIAIRTSAPVSLRLNGQLISVAEESVFCLGDFILPFNGTATTHQEDE